MAKQARTVYYYIGTHLIEIVEEVIRGLMSLGEVFAYIVLPQSIPPVEP